VLLAQGKDDEAIAELRQLVAEKPGDAEGHYELGFDLWTKNQHAEALRELATALRLDPGNQAYQEVYRSYSEQYSKEPH
jgi:cytochrome c-type biogenesis protein CcmH/NrfG